MTICNRLQSLDHRKFFDGFKNLATIAQETDKIRRLENFEVTQAEVGEQFDVLADRPVSADYLLSFNDARLGYLPRDI